MGGELPTISKAEMARRLVEQAIAQQQPPGDNEGMSQLRQDQFQMLLQRVVIAEYALKRLAKGFASSGSMVDVCTEALTKCEALKQAFLKKHPN